MAALLFFVSALFWAISGSFHSPILLSVGAFFFGFSDAFLSGNDEALMFETMEDLGKKEDFDLMYSKAGSLVQIGLACAAVMMFSLGLFANKISHLFAMYIAIIIKATMLLIFFFLYKKRKLC